ncbi:MAG: hypothetical protein A3G32_00045 [Deltaproteobacteria bacterium RIFCSPLOWO2_12_FULL_40_28]|nr:MAG: hypothetical protein A3C45_02840 [Deltaproteobacteria bacterium RIFCSPHIGHO2_02_FULL_40_28]OGQ20311.1 MAG: hypothetical protein A3E27_09425 [Deltaproteobacteria bacterium RIFCSPHIGHO2_12_FULL_40_32]OGQ40763.1 MAG: hypothetical protein A3I69_09440 [Deltaproteobacteria bacterium RIFCSPLOWO2_02_FULL_40_36]OGQ54911.1 MAG: hypothetical protein A3G32_00045 [Deltaproteobacteria bacterium RIFCSPLOWO2_12_FULL_40_28]
MIRINEINILFQRLKNSAVVALLGPRQCGKTTLARQLSNKFPQNNVHFFDLEDPVDIARLDNPILALENLKGLVIVDEIQRRPELFPILRVLVDRQNQKTNYLILGSASRDLLRQGSESLAGRVSYLELGGFSLNTAEMEQKKLWVRGTFPRSYLADNEKTSFSWRSDFITTFLERDIPNLGLSIPSATLRRFWMMLAHYHGQIFNASEMGRSFGADDLTMKRYLDILSGTFMVRQLQPWFYNTKKRLIKRPKIYFRDSGIFHALSSIRNLSELERHPKLGASWEGFALEQAVCHLGLKEEEVFFWGVHTGASLDILYQRGGSWWGIEIKYNDAPKLTPSMRSAMEELELKHLWVLYPGDKEYPLDKGVSVVPLDVFVKNHSHMSKI